MGHFARVTSIEVLETIAVGLKKFRGEAASALDDLDIELHRAQEWIHHDRKMFWDHELRRSEDRVTEAKLQLKQAKAARSLGDYRPGCVEEQRALERAQQRLRIAEQKVKAVQHWSGVIDRAVNVCQRGRTQFAVWLDSDVQDAVSLLNRMSDSLENYVSLDVPVDPNAPVVLAANAQTERVQAPEGTGAGDASVPVANPNIEKKDSEP